MSKLLNRAKAAILVASLVASTMATVITIASPASADVKYVNYGNCNEPMLFTAVGSGQTNQQSTQMTSLAQTVVSDAQADGRKVQWDPILYPAVSFTQYINPNGGKSNWLEINNSVASGVANLSSALRTSDQFCPSRPIMLAGYSQGADVVSQVVNEMPSEQKSRTSVALLGNPSFLPNLSQDYGNFNAKRRGIRSSFFQQTFQILSPTVTQRTVDACLLNDPICNYNFANFVTLANKNNAHYNYVKSGYASYAAHQLWKHAKTTFPSVTGAPELLSWSASVSGRAATIRVHARNVDSVAEWGTGGPESNCTAAGHPSIILVYENVANGDKGQVANLDNRNLVSGTRADGVWKYTFDYTPYPLFRGGRFKPAGAYLRSPNCIETSLSADQVARFVNTASFVISPTK